MSANLALDLQQFTGGETMYGHWLRRFVYTEGVKFLADEAGAYWLLDAIASHQLDRRITRNAMLQEIQFWTLKRSGTSAMLAVFEDSGRPPVLTQEIKWTDFPLDEVKLYLANGVLMLPSEY